MTSSYVLMWMICGTARYDMYFEHSILPIPFDRPPQQARRILKGIGKAKYVVGPDGVGSHQKSFILLE